jgi:hypothetical protein
MKLTPCQAESKEECEVCRELFSDALSMISAGPEADQYGKIEKGYFDWWDPQQYVRVCHCGPRTFYCIARPTSGICHGYQSIRVFMKACINLGV